EWGYWQQDYAVGLWHWDVDVSLDQVVAELVEPFCPVAAWPDGCAAGREAAAVLDAAMADQVDTFLTAVDWEGRAGGLYAYFAGEDPGDEIAAVTGFEFRPVKVAFQRVLRWSDAQAQHFAETDLAALAAFAERWDALLARLEAVRADVPDEGVRWFEELRDGVAIDALRAHQTHGLYAAILAFRAAPKDDPAVTTPLAEAAAALADAEAVIRRREAMYRYPAAQEYGGGLTPETAVDNGTTYPYRVHTKTHLMTYWLNRDAEVAAILAGDEDDGPRLEVGPTFADPGVAAQIAWPDLPGLGGSLAMGDGATVTPPTTEHAYAATPAIWAVSGVLTSLGSEIPVAGTLVRTTHRARADGLALAEPDSDVARTVLESLAPPFLVAIDTESTPPVLAFATDGDQDGDAPFDGVTRVPLDEAGETAFTSAPVLLSLPIADPSSGNVAATLRVQAAIFSGPLLEGDFAGDVAIAGDLVIDDLVDAL
ncbi:MAG: hypothetical protein KC635_17250, partial [Myxococcales bacterium]|nr:hypothetical protein [Myxococcales bacterium]